MECPQIDLYEFLAESELQHYYNAIKNELKITNAAQFKYATDEDLKNIGLSRPEIRRLRKFYERHFPHGYLSKIKRLLQAPTAMVKRDDGNTTPTQTSVHTATESTSTTKAAVASPSKVSNNKHIIPADCISVNKQLGTGEFGIVQQGVWTNGNERIQVAIKCLCRERVQSHPMEFLKEAAIMHSIEHENIVRLYGVVLASDSLMLVTELAHLRSLLECLKDSGLRLSFLTIPTLCEFGMQICNGMRYLENKRLIHRDLAARNILVFSKNKVKISDFGLSRALGVGKDYYKTNFNVNLKLPIAWCAPECINFLRFTNASDVWAYGVCLWEMFSYGFQPWAALTGLQILEAIDAPNYQRLEQPDCCPQEYYTLMMKCWQDDPTKRPKFNEIYEMLPEMKPEQLKTVVHCIEPKKDHLVYRQGEIITVLDRNTGTPFWKGVLSTGKTGLFNPSNTVAYLEGLPSSNRDSFSRISERSSKRKLRTEMISKPQNDFKHTGHVGIDGDSFGDVAFLSNSQNYNHVPRQIVTPYKPSEDIEQTPLLLPPTPTSPDSLQTASAYFPEGTNTPSMNPSFVSSTENTPKHFTSNGQQSSFEFPPGQHVGIDASTNPFAHRIDESTAFAMQNNNYGVGGKSLVLLTEMERITAAKETFDNGIEEQHEYHEISDDEMTADKLDFGPSLLDEINSMFGSMSASVNQPKSPDLELINKKNEFAEMSSKLVHKHSTGDNNGNKFGVTSLSKKKSSGTVKPISVKDEKILNQAIEIANEFSARSMVDLVSDQQPTATQSPKRKFSFRFPHLTHGGGASSSEKSNHNGSSVAGSSVNGSTAQHGMASPHSKKKNFTEELKSIPDLQAIIGEKGNEAYNSLIERKTTTLGVTVGLSPAATLLRHFDTNEFEMTSAAKTLPRRSMHLQHDNDLDATMAKLGTTQTRNPISLRGDNHNLDIPLKNAPRPMTLPTRGAASRVKKVELNANTKTLLTNATRPHDAENNQQDNDDNNKSSPCESPSYLSNTCYKFPAPMRMSAMHVAGDINPIPLPPRDGKKHIKTSAKRHVRKYPLIIPANGVQRTLNKVTEIAAIDELKTPNSVDSSQHGNDSNNANNLQCITHEVVASIRPNTRMPQTASSAANEQPDNQPKRNASPTYQNFVMRADAMNNADSASLQFESILEADTHKCNVLQSPDVTDGFYNFSIQKEHYNKSKNVDYDPKKISGLYVNEDELRNLDIERQLKNVDAADDVADNIPAPTAITATTFASSAEPNLTITNSNDALATVANIVCNDKAKHMQTTTATTTSTSKVDNELAANALFRKVRKSVDIAMRKSMANASNNNAAQHSNAATPATITTTTERQQTEAEYFAATAARLASSNSVSCEDLLEFSDKKPKGCERGVDSDEVRIMMKVLGKDSTPTRCLLVLEFIDWDVHKAIKIIKLQNKFSTAELSLIDAVEMLQQHDWDFHAAIAAQ